MSSIVKPRRPRRATAFAALVCIGASLLSPTLRAEDYSIVPQQFVYCTTCHGVELSGNRAVSAPRLNGMEDWYVRNQLTAFRNGWRGTHPLDLTGMEMRPQAAVLDETGVEAAVAFVTGVAEREKSADSISGDRERGEALYSPCAACHGERAEGNRTLNAPRLAGQSDWYLADQLEKFRIGSRGGSAGDTYGAQMRAAVGTLPDEDAVADVVAYINTLD